MSQAVTIKIRGWDGEKMWYTTLQDLIENLGSQSFGDNAFVDEVGEDMAGFAGGPHWDRRPVDYMLCTGLPDYDTISLIYAGDLIQCTANCPGRGYTTIVLYHEGSFYESHEGKPNEVITAHHIDVAGFIVIGNIYETPHLIPEKERDTI